MKLKWNLGGGRMQEPPAEYKGYVLEKRQEFLSLIMQSSAFGIAVVSWLGHLQGEGAQAMQLGLQASVCGVIVAGLLLHVLT